MTLLARACWPNNFNMVAGGGLVLAAAVDLSWTLEMWITGLLLLLHFSLVLLFDRRAQLCQPSPELWEWSSAYDMHSGEHA